MQLNATLIFDPTDKLIRIDLWPDLEPPRSRLLLAEARSGWSRFGVRFELTCPAYS